MKNKGYGNRSFEWGRLAGLMVFWLDPERFGSSTRRKEEGK
jgi:hypothetical protein